MANKDLCRVRQRVDLLNWGKQCFWRSPWEITTCRTNIRLEHTVSRKQTVTNQVRHRIRSMARCGNNFTIKSSQLPRFIIFPKMIKLVSVRYEIRGRQIEHTSKNLLDLSDSLTDTNRSLQCQIKGLLANESLALFSFPFKYWAAERWSAWAWDSRIFVTMRLFSAT